MNALVSLVAALVERFVGYPPVLTKHVGHPVIWMGKAIAYLEHAMNDEAILAEERRRNGIIMLTILGAGILIITIPLSTMMRSYPLGWVLEAALASTLIAQKELGAAVGRVAEGLRSSLGEGREAVSHVVGRDPDELDESGVARGAIESLAENFSDGVVAPVFYLLLFGLPGIALYKLINTADSMVGHRNKRYEQFGWFSAKLDDVVNFIPARITAALIALTAQMLSRFDGEGAWRATQRDARHHVSPNAGWPEAAMAGALGITLGGPRAYRGETVELARMGDGREELRAEDIDTALYLYRSALAVMLGFLAIAALIFWRY